MAADSLVDRRRFRYFSDKNFDHGSCSIAIDGKVVKTVSTTTPQVQPVSALFQQALDPGPHTITITNLDDTKGLGIDYFS